jgi:DNA-binding SARP family transcriptional activator
LQADFVNGAPQVIRLHLLGAQSIDAGGGAVPRSPFSQPRRAALLAYLVLRTRRGPQRRDTLLGVFWPESDTSHGRNALRNALHFLRQCLGRGVIESDGDEAIRIEPGRLWCDVVDFEQRCDAGDHAGALDGYTGDLLDGFFISDAPEFERWLDSERERLRVRAVAAARALAAQAESRAEADTAVIRLRQVLQLAPTDESAARRLMRLLAASGDRGEALHVLDELRVRLQGAYGLQPAAETLELARSIRRPAPIRRVRRRSAQPQR